MAQKGGDLFRIAGKQERGDFRAAGLKLGAFGGAVVDHQEALQAQVQLGGDGNQAGRFGLPIDSAGREVAGLERHLRVGAEGVEHVLLVVLAAETEQAARLALGQHELLEETPGRIERYAFGAILGADAAPEGLIAIQQNRLTGRSAEGVDAAGQQSGQSREEGGRIGNVAELVGVRVVVVRDRVEGRQFGGRDDVNGAQALERRGELGLEEGRRRRAESHQEGRMERIRGGAQRQTQAADVVLEGGGFARARPVLEAHQHHVETVAVARQQALGIEQLLKDLVVRGEGDLVVPTQLVDPELERRADRFRGEGGGDGQEGMGHQCGCLPVAGAGAWNVT